MVVGIVHQDPVSLSLYSLPAPLSELTTTEQASIDDYEPNNKNNKKYTNLFHVTII